MRKYFQFVLTCGLLIGGTATLSAQAQQTQDAAKKAGQTAERAVTGDATYGRVKEFSAGKKLVIDINNAPDRTFDLAKERDVVVAPGLKVGDPVKITESEAAGKKMVNVAMDNTPGVEHGDPHK